MKVSMRLEKEVLGHLTDFEKNWIIAKTSENEK